MLKKLYKKFLDNCEKNIKFELDKFYETNSNSKKPDDNNIKFEQHIKYLLKNSLTREDGTFISNNKNYNCYPYFFNDSMYIQFNIKKEISHDFLFQMSFIHNITEDKYTLYLGIHHNQNSSERLYVCYDENFKIIKDINYLRSQYSKMPSNNPKADENSILYRNDIVEFLFNNNSDLNEYLSLLELQFDFNKNDNDIVLSGIVQCLVMINKLDKTIENKPKLMI